MTSFTFLAFLSILSSLLLPKCPVTFSITAPAHPHATRVAVCTALLKEWLSCLAVFSRGLATLVCPLVRPSVHFARVGKCEIAHLILRCTTRACVYVCVCVCVCVSLCVLCMVMGGRGCEKHMHKI